MTIGKRNDRTGFFQCWLIAVVVAGITLGAPASAQQRPKIEVVPVSPHSYIVNTVTFSSDGALIVSGSWDSTTRLWDAATGRLLRIFEGPTHAVSAVAISRDSMEVAAASTDGTITLWEASTGKVLRRFVGHQGGVAAIALTPDGKAVLSGGGWLPGIGAAEEIHRSGGQADGTLRLWDAASGQLVRTFSGHAGGVTSLAVSSDGSLVLSGGEDNAAKLWNVATATLIRTFKGHSRPVASVAFSFDHKLIATGSDDKTLRIWEASTGRLLQTLVGHSDAVSSVAFTPKAGQIVSASKDKTLRLWELASGKEVRSFKGHSAWVSSVSVSPDGARVLSGSWDGGIKVWETARGQTLRSIEEHTGRINSVAYSADGAFLASAHGKPANAPRVWDATTGRLIATLEGHAKEVNAVSFSPDGSRLLSASVDKTVKLWEARTGKLVDSFEAHTEGVSSVAFSPDGKHFATASADRTINIWDIASKQVVLTLRGHTDGVNSVAFSQDGSVLASGSWDKTVRIWDLHSGKLLRKLEGHRGGVTSVAISPDGRHVASGSGAPENCVKLWSSTGRLLRTFEPHLSIVRSVAFSPNGSHVLSASWDRSMKLWDVSKEAPTMSIAGHAGWVHSAVFSPDGRQILSGSWDGSMKRWRVSTGEPIATLIAGERNAWLTMTAAGFFSGSDGGSETLSVVRGLEVTSVAQLYDHLYRPDLVEEALKGDPEGKYKDDAFRLNLQKILDSGPAPQIEHLRQRDSRANDTYQLAVRVTDTGGGIGGRVVWRINGRTKAVSSARVDPGAATDKAAIVMATLRVDPGEDTTVEVTAYNGAGLVATVPYAIRIDKFGATTEERPRMHVLAMGVNQYQMPDYRLKFAVKDARTFGEALLKVGNALFGEGSVLVTTLVDEQVTERTIAATFDQIAAKAKLSDVFVLYLSGHGKSVAGRYYFYPQTLDFSKGQRVEEHAIGQDAWQAWIARIPAEKKVLIIDTCESSAASGLVRGDSSRLTAMDQLQHATGENLIAAARQAAFEGWQGHGVLTFALLEAMSNGGGSGDEGRIKIGYLANYVDERVPDISRRLTGLDQRPTRRLSGNDFPIGIRQVVLTPGGPESLIPKAPTHVLIRQMRVREQPRTDALGERELAPGTQVRLLQLVPGTNWVLIARDGQKLGYVSADVLAPLQ